MEETNRLPQTGDRMRFMQHEATISHRSLFLWTNFWPWHIDGVCCMPGAVLSGAVDPMCFMKAYLIDWLIEYGLTSMKPSKDYSKNPCLWEIHEISNSAAEAWVATQLWIYHGHGFLFLSHDLNMGFSFPIYDEKFTKDSFNPYPEPQLAVGSTHAWAYALNLNWPHRLWTRHHSRQDKYSQVHLGDVWAILCPSNALSVPYVPNNPSTFEKYVTEPDQHSSWCVVSLFWPNFPYKEVNKWLRDVFAQQRLLNAAESYRTRCGRSKQFCMGALPHKIAVVMG